VLPTTPGSYTLSVTLYPTDTAHYVTATKTVTLELVKITPVINWSGPASVHAGAVLGATQLDATATASGATVPGTFVYTPPAGTVLNDPKGVSGEQLLSVTFTPNDQITYNTATKTVGIYVYLDTPTISWTPAPITWGTALGSAQLDATASYSGTTVPGTFAYTPAAGTVFSAPGVQSLSVTFTPSDPTTYASVTKTVKIKVGKVTPTITWGTSGTLPAITYGTKLSATQLNATASVPGTFTYHPAAGTVPVAGTQTLSVTFTPTDTTDYATATATVTIAVSQVTPTVFSLKSSATSITAGSPVTFTAKLSGTGSGVKPTGTVTFYDGTTSLGTGTLASGIATLNTSGLTTTGAHSITASYPGDSNYLATNSNVVTVTVQ
jgi:hypothetical protein